MDDLHNEILVITKSMEKLVRESMRRDNKMIDLERKINTCQNSMRDMAQEINGLRQEVVAVQQELGRAQNKLDLVEYENAHETHLNQFMQEEAVKDATDFAMTPKDISKGATAYNSNRAKFGMGRVGQ